MLEISKWDRRFYRMAEEVSSWSKDPSTKVGAILVGEDPRNIAVGYNGFPPGVHDWSERLWDREIRLKLTQHAEMNALAAARFDTDRATLYVTFFPCASCATMIASKRIKRVVCPEPSDREPWKSDAAWTRIILNESGIVIALMKSEDSNE